MGSKMKYLVQILRPEQPVLEIADGANIRTPTESFDNREDAEAYRLQLMKERNK
jgi:hypothetical protein